MCKPIVDSLCSTAGICTVMQIIMPKQTSCKHSPHTASFSPQLPQVLPHKYGVSWLYIVHVH